MAVGGGIEKIKALLTAEAVAATFLLIEKYGSVTTRPFTHCSLGNASKRATGCGLVGDS